MDKTVSEIRAEALESLRAHLKPRFDRVVSDILDDFFGEPHMKATVRLVLQPTDNGVKPHMTLTLGEDVYVVFDGRLPPDCQAGCTQEHIAELDLPTIKPA